MDNKEFAVHILNDAGKRKARDIAMAFDACLSTVAAICPNSRELSLARTKLEEACFFAKKAMAALPENQEGTPT